MSARSESGIAAATAAEKGGVVFGERCVSGDDLRLQAAHVAACLKAMGVGAGDTVAILLRNDIPFLSTTLAAFGLEAYPVAMNWHGNAAEVEYILRDSKAKVLVVHADLLLNVEHAVPAECRVIVVPTPPEVCAAYGLRDSPGNFGSFGTMERERLEWFDCIRTGPAVDIGPRGLRGSIIYTSGTTGRPKGVVRAPAEGAAAVAMRSIVDEIYGVSPEATVRTVVTGPMYHAAPNFFSMRAVEGNSLAVLQARFDETDLLRLIERYRITHLHMVPTMFIRLLRLPPEVRHAYDLSSLCRVIHAAAPCPPEVKKKMIEWWGPIIYEYYGGTETGAVILHGSDEAMRKPGTVGRAMNNCEVAVLDEAGNRLKPYEIGEIFARNHNLPDFSYQGLPSKRAEVERAGLITVGDVGYLDEDGYLFLCDRKRDVVISGGVNIYPAEIEMELVLMPGVQDCAVFGIPDEEYGEVLCAHVEPVAGIDIFPEQITTWLGARLARAKVPRVIEIDKKLPREDSGKVMKRKLRDAYWDSVGRKI